MTKTEIKENNRKNLIDFLMSRITALEQMIKTKKGIRAIEMANNLEKLKGFQYDKKDAGFIKKFKQKTKQEIADLDHSINFMGRRIKDHGDWIKNLIKRK